MTQFADQQVRFQVSIEAKCVYYPRHSLMKSKLKIEFPLMQVDWVADSYNLVLSGKTVEFFVLLHDHSLAWIA